MLATDSAVVIGLVVKLVVGSAVVVLLHMLLSGHRSFVPWQEHSPAVWLQLMSCTSDADPGASATAVNDNKLRRESAGSSTRQASTNIPMANREV